MKLLTKQRAQELANELGIKIIGYGNKSPVLFFQSDDLLADFEDVITPKKPWPYPRATDADKGKAVFFKDASMPEWHGPYVFDGKEVLISMTFTCPVEYRLADPDNLTQPPPDGLED